MASPKQNPGNRSLLAKFSVFGASGRFHLVTLQSYVQHVPHDLSISVPAHLHIISKLQQTATNSVAIGRVFTGTGTGYWTTGNPC